jgi:RNA polymerase sigma-70 factor (ECF subfamily)
MTAQPLPALMARIAEGDRSALALLYDQTSRLVYGLALQAVPDARGAQEVALEVYLRVWRNAAAYGAAHSSVLTWLAALTRDSAEEWTEHHPARENQAMDRFPESLLAARKGVA